MARLVFDGDEISRASSGGAFRWKRAVSKAFGTGMAKRWVGAAATSAKSGEPFLVLSGPAQAYAAQRASSALITLSHTEHHAVACVVLEGAATGPGEERLAVASMSNTHRQGSSASHLLFVAFAAAAAISVGDLVHHTNAPPAEAVLAELQPVALKNCTYSASAAQTTAADV